MCGQAPSYNVASLISQDHHCDAVLMMNSDRERCLRLIFWLGVSIGLLLSFGYQLNQIIGGDQTQMIHKGYLGAHHGIWLNVGNVASVVGNVPGSLSAGVVAAPLLLWDSPYAIIIFLTLLRLAGFLLLDAVVRQALPQSTLVRLIFLLLIWLNPWVQYDSLLYNPAYLLFCAGLHLFSAWRLREQPSFWMTLIHVASIGLAMQLHFSWPLLAILSVYLWIRGLIRINWWAVVLAVAAIIVSLLPYLRQLIDNPEMARHSDPGVQDRYIGWGAVHVYPVLKSVIYWLRYGAWAFPSKLVNDAGFGWITVAPWLALVMKVIWLGILYSLSVVTMVFSVIANVSAFKRIKPLWRAWRAPVNNTNWLLLYAFGAFVAVLISAALSPLVFNYWHLVLILPAAVLPILIWLVQTVYRGSEANLKPIWVCAAILIVVNLVAMTDSRKFSWEADYEEQVLQYVENAVRAPSGNVGSER